MAQQPSIVGLGEALFDLLPGGKELGGAPLNVAYHAQQLLSRGATRHPHPGPLPEGEGMGGAGVVASRIGADLLGSELLAELAKRGMTDEFVQRDAEHPTGTVHVALERGQPTYEIVKDVAWDHFQWSAAWKELAAKCAAVSFGTLAQRSTASRQAIRRFLDAAPQAVRLLDVNLRQQFYDRNVLEESCRRATLVKLNEQELATLAELLRLQAAGVDGQLAELRSRYELEAVVYTRGTRGTLLVLDGGVIDPEPVSYPAAASADGVGAGDACSAGILVGWVQHMPPARIGTLANQLGAYVAAQAGATPKLPPEIIELVA